MTTKEKKVVTHELFLDFIEDSVRRAKEDFKISPGLVPGLSELAARYRALSDDVLISLLSAAIDRFFLDTKTPDPDDLTFKSVFARWARERGY